jgi:hypothetical protein
MWIPASITSFFYFVLACKYQSTGTDYSRWDGTHHAYVEQKLPVSTVSAMYVSIVSFTDIGTRPTWD